MISPDSWMFWTQERRTFTWTSLVVCQGRSRKSWMVTFSLEACRVWICFCVAIALFDGVGLIRKRWLLFIIWRGWREKFLGFPWNLLHTLDHISRDFVVLISISIIVNIRKVQLKIRNPKIFYGYCTSNVIRLNSLKRDFSQKIKSSFSIFWVHLI